MYIFSCDFSLNVTLNLLPFMCFAFVADIRMSKAAEEEKPGADYPGDSSGNSFCTNVKARKKRIFLNVQCFRHVFSLCVSDSDRNSPDEQVGAYVFSTLNFEVLCRSWPMAAAEGNDPLLQCEIGGG